MADGAARGAGFEGRAVRVHPYADARAVMRVLRSSFLWLAILAAVARLVVAVLAPAGFFLLMPLALSALLLALTFMVCLLCTPPAWLWAAIGLGTSSVRVSGKLQVELPGGPLSFRLLSLVSARLSPSGAEVALTTHDGDVIRVATAGAGDVDRLLDAVATAGERGTWSARLYDEEDGSRLLRSIPGVLRGHAARWLPQAPVVASGALVAAACWPVLGGNVALSVGVVAGAAGWVLRALLRRAPPEAVVVGEDGIAVHGDGERFVPFRHIEHVDETWLGVHLTLSDGERLTLTVVPPRLLHDPGATGLTLALAERRRDHLLSLLRARHGRCEDGAAGAGALLERQGRSARAWQAATRELLRDAGADYRSARLMREQAVQVLEDGAAPAELRIGAALALSDGGDREATRLVRIAADACASREMREALEQAAEGEIDDSTLERALLSSGAPRARV